MKSVFFAVYNDCMTCVCSSCKSNNIFCVLCKVINDFTFSFIAPLEAKQ